MTLKWSIIAHLCITTQETDKQAVAKLKQDYMDITGYLHYARALEVETRTTWTLLVISTMQELERLVGKPLESLNQTA